MRQTTIPGLTNEVKRSFFPLENFAIFRTALGRAVTAGEQHEIIQSLFLETRRIQIDGKTFDTMSKCRYPQNRTSLPLIEFAGIKNSFGWYTEHPRVEENGMAMHHHAMPKLTALILPRSYQEVVDPKKYLTTFLYDLTTEGTLIQARTSDTFTSRHPSLAPDESIHGTVFEMMGKYLLSCIEARLVVVAGRGHIDEPSYQPSPIQYTSAEIDLS